MARLDILYPMRWWGLRIGWRSRYRTPTPPVEGITEGSRRAGYVKRHLFGFVNLSCGPLERCGSVTTPLYSRHSDCIVVMDDISGNPSSFHFAENFWPWTTGPSEGLAFVCDFPHTAQAYPSSADATRYLDFMYCTYIGFVSTSLAVCLA